MLRRLAMGVMNDPALSGVLIPLTFREEQYNVHNLHVFWCNCLDALADFLENSGQRDAAEQLDREIGNLHIDPDGSVACTLFKEWCAQQRKRPLLLVDNIDLIFTGLKEQHQWGLRRILQERGGVVVVGASAGLLEAATKVEAPFYDFFQVHQLEKLTHPELLSCLRRIALKRAKPGNKVLKVLDSDPARIQTLYDLTGGNPRTLVLLYLLLELDSEGDVMDDLERLLDQVTALYKARVEDLAPQTRVVLDAVALAWNPVTVAKVAAETGIETTSVSSQFDRLMKMGILEKVSLSTPAPTGYQLGERFFNIWYLMRNASRRMRNRLRWLTEFLRRLYTPQQLSILADDFIRRSREKSRCSGVYGLALADALEDDTRRHGMNHHVTRLFQEQAAALCEQLDKLIDRSDLDQTTLTMADAKKLVLSCKRDWGSTTAEEFWDVFGGSPLIPAKKKLALASDLQNLDTEKIESIVKLHSLMNEELKRTIGLPEALGLLYNAIREGMLSGSSDLAHAMAAAREYECPELPLVMICLTDSDQLSLSPDIADQLFAAVQPILDQPDGRFNSNCFYHWGRFLTYSAFPAEAKHALRKSIELDPKAASSWIGLGNLFQDKLNRYEEAEQAYLRAIELDPENSTPWNNLGNLLLDKLNRYEEAELAYRKAIELDPKDTLPWINLGILLNNKLNRPEEAEIAYRKAIELDPEVAVPWFNLGNLFQNILNRHEEAEQAYGKAIELDPEDGRPWNNLGGLLQDHLSRPEEAETAYRRAIELGETDMPKSNLAYLLLSQPARGEDAEAAYAEAIELLPEHGRLLLAGYRAMTRDNFGEAMENLAEVLEENHPELFTEYLDDLLRLLRLARTRAHGERLMTFLRESGLAERHWPLSAAFDAYLHGEERLRDVNPEVRGAARRIFDWLESSPEAKPQHTSSAAQKRAGRKTSRQA
ncbi:MAG: tetratricopeptide repeat protein [Geobacter sp.]|nr:tetratricopeptide repeat protein [Geobacter sp.]